MTNYPAGSDNIYAPWNQRDGPHMEPCVRCDGAFRDLTERCGKLYCEECLKCQHMTQQGYAVFFCGAPVSGDNIHCDHHALQMAWKELPDAIADNDAEWIEDCMEVIARLERKAA